MKKNFAWFLILLLGIVTRAPAQASAPLKLIQTIPLPNVPGALDYMAIDVQRQRLFIPAEQHQTVEVVDLSAGKMIRTIGDVSWPSTVAYHPQSDKIFVTDRSDGTVKVFKGDNYELVKTIKLIKGPANATYDQDTQYFSASVAGSGGNSLHIDCHH